MGRTLKTKRDEQKSTGNDRGLGRTWSLYQWGFKNLSQLSTCQEILCTLHHYLKAPDHANLSISFKCSYLFSLVTVCLKHLYAIIMSPHFPAVKQALNI